MAPSFPSLPLLAVLVILCATMPALPSPCGAMLENVVVHDLLMLGRFHRWMSAHNRSYAGAREKLRRFEVYRSNMEYIDAANAAGELGYELGENEFTDLTHEEFMARYTGGIMKEAEYSYEAQQGQCRTNGDAIRRGKIYQIGMMKSEERYLQEAVYKRGPTAVGIDSRDRNLQHFKSGIYKGPCGTALNHGVLVVGYGARDGEKYWVVKNSWGQTFGENGFFLVSRGADGKAGLCGIAMRAVYALV